MIRRQTKQARTHRRTGRFVSAPLLAAALTLAAGTALATPESMFVAKTRVLGEDGFVPRTAPDSETLELVQRIDAALHEAVQDLDLSVDVSERTELPTDLTGELLVEHAAERWALSPELIRTRSGYVLRLVAVPPGSSVQLVRAQAVTPDEIEMRVVLMLRDVVEAHSRVPRATNPAVPLAEPGNVAAPTQSSGRAILALNAALLGGYAGYSVQEASDSDDDRLTYPLVALGAGVGLGSSLLVAEEWNIGVGDAWFLSAGMWWPTLSGFLISQSYDVSDEDRFAYGLLGAAAGVTLTTTVLSFGGASEGDAMLAHSGGTFGTLLGGITELAIEGATDKTPRRGMGYGAGAGFLAATALLTQVELTATRVLLIDLGASLGALTGAAAASPLLLVEEGQDERKRNRVWLASIGAGTILGGFVGWWATRSMGGSSASHHAPPFAPTLGVIGAAAEGPLYGAGLHGTW